MHFPKVTDNEVVTKRTRQWSERSKTVQGGPVAHRAAGKMSRGCGHGRSQFLSGLAEERWNFCSPAQCGFLGALLMIKDLPRLFGRCQCQGRESRHASAQKCHSWLVFTGCMQSWGWVWVQGGGEMPLFTMGPERERLGVSVTMLTTSFLTPSWEPAKTNSH